VGINVVFVVSVEEQHIILSSHVSIFFKYFVWVHTGSARLVCSPSMIENIKAA
jgi:hypothetical protein